MAESTGIEWTDATWNPVTGCDKVSEECKFCYALELAPRLRAMGNAKYLGARDGRPPTSGPAFGVTLHESELERPSSWRRPRKIFVCSMADLFHEEVPTDFIARIFGVMAAADQHTFQVLTKRPERMAELLGHPEFIRQSLQASGCVGLEWPLPNVWVGTSIGKRNRVGRADVLRQVPAVVRFISAEPLLGPLVAGLFDRWFDADSRSTGWMENGRFTPELNLRGIDWVIAGGESGSHMQRMPGRFLVGPDRQPIPERAEWVRDLKNRCFNDRVAFLFKQWGGRTPKWAGRDLDGHVWDQFPKPRDPADSARWDDLRMVAR